MLKSWLAEQALSTARKPENKKMQKKGTGVSD